MTTFYVPIEHTQAPEAQRWFFAAYDVTSPLLAMVEARLEWGDARRFTIWAAMRECPTFDDMRELRRSLDNMKQVRRTAKAKAPMQEEAYA